MTQDFFGPWSKNEKEIFPKKGKSRKKAKNKKNKEETTENTEKTDAIPTNTMNFVDLTQDFGIALENVPMIKNVHEFNQHIDDIGKWPYLALDLEFVPTSIIGQVHEMSLLQVAGFDPEQPDNIQSWVIDLLHPSKRNKLSDPNIAKLTDNEYKQLIKLVLDKIIGSVSSTKLGIGLVKVAPIKPKQKVSPSIGAGCCKRPCSTASLGSKGIL